MIQSDRLRIVLDGYRAVKHADVAVGDLTVLSGVNASGKSTIAHLFHALVNLSRDYEALAVEYAWREMRSILSAAGRLHRRLPSASREGDREASHRVFLLRREFDDARESDEKRRIAEVIFDCVGSRYLEAVVAIGEDADRYLRSFAVDAEFPDERVLTWESIVDWINERIRAAESSVARLTEERSREVWHEANDDVIKWVSYAGEVGFYEGERCVCRLGREGDRTLREILDVEHAFYISSPWLNRPIQTADGGISIDDGFVLRGSDSQKEIDRTLFAALEGEVTEDPAERELYEMQARPYARERWMYSRVDGHEPFPLEDCATGIKSLSLLNFLYTRNALGRKTLLIVDEPEAHLHPQWIVEYAKILVRLNRRLGVRLLITTHNPDMLNALRRVANVEEVPDVRFYVAEEVSKEDRFNFTYRDLGRHVEDIFRKFNLASDRVELYPDDSRWD